MTQRRVILTADDFGFATIVNETVELAHRHGMVGAAAAGDSGARPRAVKHHIAELQAPTSTRVRDTMAAAGIQPISFSELQR